METLYHIILLISVVLTVSSAIAALITKTLAEKKRKNQTQIRKDIEHTRQTLWNKIAQDLAVAVDKKLALKLLIKEPVLDIGITPYTDLPELFKENIKKELEEQTDALREKLEKIENRFPHESTLEKLASVNDAILGTKIEDIQKSIDRIENRILTKWDVAKIVFTIIGSLGALIGLTIVIIKLSTGAGSG